MSSTFFRLESTGLERHRPQWGRNECERRADGTERTGRWISPFKVIVSKSQMTDIIWAGSQIALLSRRAVDLFAEAGFTGYSLAPAEVRTLFPVPGPPEYWLLSITGWGGVAPPESGVHLTLDPRRHGRSCYTGPTQVSHLIDLNQWDGSDFFIVWPLPRFIFVTERVAALIREYKLARCRLVPLEKMSFSPPLPNTSVQFMPGRLSDYFDDERAEKIGKPLGIE